MFSYTMLMLQLETFSFFPKRNQGGLDVHSSLTALEGVGQYITISPPEKKF